MAKITTDGILDSLLAKLATCTTLTVCAGQPTSQADIAARALASVAITGGDFTIANGDVSGRKTTLGQQADIAITTSGTADHVAIDDGTDYAVTTVASQALTAGGTVTVNAFDHEVGDPI